MNTMKRKIIAVALPVALVASGFALDRLSTPSPANALTNPAAATPAGAPNANAASNAANMPVAERGEHDFYLSDYKQGYSEGFRQARSGEEASLVNSTRPGYNEGFKEGYANGYQEVADHQEMSTSPAREAQPQSVVYRTPRSSYAARPTYTYREPRRSKMGPKTKAALRIAAPAAVGAGIGAIAGGKKGAGVGALIGGGGGALYHLWKERR